MQTGSAGFVSCAVLVCREDNERMFCTQDRAELLKQLAATPLGAEVTCSSPSMEPTICVGERVRVHAVAPSSLRIGDVVVFSGQLGIMLHRVVMICPRRQYLLHVGDAPSKHGPRRAPMSAVIGRVHSLPRQWPTLRVYLTATRNAGLGVYRRLCRLMR